MSDVAGPPLVRPRFLKWSLVVFVLLMPFVAHAVWDYIESRRLARIVSTVRAAQEPTSLYEARYVGPSSPEGVNAGRYYRAAAALATPSERGRAPSPAASEALAYLDRATPLKFEGFQSGNDYNYIPDGLLTLARLTHERTRALAERGDGDGAAASLFSHLRLLRGLDHSFASLVSVGQPVEDVEHLLSTSRPGAAALARLDAAFADADRDDALRQMLLREQGFLLDRGLRDATMRDATWWNRPLVLKRLNDRLENVRVLVRMASRPWPRPLDLPEGDVGADDRTTMRSVDESKFRMAAWNAAAMRAARIAINAVRYRDSHGAWPRDVSALVPEYLSSAPVDPYIGKPMRALVDADGRFVAYSVGINRQDDRGHLSPDARGVRRGQSIPTATAEGDVGIRIAVR